MGRASQNQPERHPIYYFPMADTVCIVDNVLFKVHKHFLCAEQSSLRDRYSWSSNEGALGSSDKNPLPIEDTDAESFAWFLWVFYNPEYSIYRTKRENWISILALADLWGFPKMKTLAVRGLEVKSNQLDPVDKIDLYQKYRVDSSHLVDAFTKLTERPEPISVEEGTKIGLLTSLNIAKARELSRGEESGGHYASSPVRLGGDKIENLVRGVFELPEDPARKRGTTGGSPDTPSSSEPPPSYSDEKAKAEITNAKGSKNGLRR